jgi:hypothetical protein
VQDEPHSAYQSGHVQLSSYGKRHRDDLGYDRPSGYNFGPSDQMILTILSVLL